MNGQGKRLNWRISIKEYGGRKFEGGFLGKIIDANRVEIYAGPDTHHSLRAGTKEQAEARAQMICDAVNDHSKSKILRTKVEVLIHDIQGGMTIQKSEGSAYVHKSIHKKKLEVFIKSYYKLFGIDLNEF